MALTINLGLTADATGTANAITATYSPAPTLVDKKILFLVSVSPNTSTAPTFSPNGLTARPIVKNGGALLSSGDIVGLGHVIILEYNLANTRWELLNPRGSSSGSNFVPYTGATSNVDIGTHDFTAENIIVNNRINSVEIVAPVGSAILQLADGSSFNTNGAFDQTLTFSNTTNATIPSGTNTLYSTKANSITSAELRASLTNESGTGAALFSSGDIGTPTAGVLTNCTGLPLSGITGYQGYTLQGGAASIAAADSTSYHCGPHYGQAFSTTGGFRKLFIPKTGTIKACYLFFTNTIAGTTETSTVSIRLNDTTDTTVSSAVTNNANPSSFSNTALSIAVVAGDFIELKWATPAWVTNPTSVFNWVIYIE